MTRVSTRKSAAVAQAEPIAIPRSTELIAHGTKSGFSTQVSKPQWAQFKPCTFWEVPIITTASALSFLLFILLYIPCIATVAAIGAEAGWKWAALSLIYNTGLAWIVAWAAYHLLLWL